MAGGGQVGGSGNIQTCNVRSEVNPCDRLPIIIEINNENSRGLGVGCGRREGRSVPRNRGCCRCGRRSADCDSSYERWRANARVNCTSSKWSGTGGVVWVGDRQLPSAQEIWIVGNPGIEQVRIRDRVASGNIDRNAVLRRSDRCAGYKSCIGVRATRMETPAKLQKLRWNVLAKCHAGRIVSNEIECAGETGRASILYYCVGLSDGWRSNQRNNCNGSQFPGMESSHNKPPTK